jgi:hypothetical protein
MATHCGRPLGPLPQNREASSTTNISIRRSMPHSKFSAQDRRLSHSYAIPASTDVPTQLPVQYIGIDSLSINYAVNDCVRNSCLCASRRPIRTWNLFKGPPTGFFGRRGSEIASGASSRSSICSGFATCLHSFLFSSGSPSRELALSRHCSGGEYSECLRPTGMFPRAKRCEPRCCLHSRRHSIVMDMDGFLGAHGSKLT